VVTIERRNDPPAVERILRSLPARFRIEAAIRDYVADAAVKASYLALEDGEPIGGALVERHLAESAERHLIAVEPNKRGTGVGTHLVAFIEKDLRSDGVRLFQVKTVGSFLP